MYPIDLGPTLYRRDRNSLIIENLIKEVQTTEVEAIAASLTKVVVEKEMNSQVIIRTE